MELFLKIFNMSITASWLVLAIILLRFLLKKAPKWVNCILWGLVGIRLICPFSFESMFSLIPSTEPIPKKIISGPSFEVDFGIEAINDQINDKVIGKYFEGVTVPYKNGETMMTAFTIVWLVGIAVMLAYTLISYIKIYRKVGEAARYEGNIFICDRVDTPFILGIIRPKIFLPSSMSEADRKYVIAHERAHLKRRDHIWKPLGFALLTVYWFNPIIWLAYILLCRDIESACDEKVIKELGSDIKKDYSNALINCSVPRKSIAACPLAFGETGVKGRIKSVLSYKKPAFWIIIIAVIACIAASVCLLTDPRSEESNKIGLATTRYGSDSPDVALKVTEAITEEESTYITVSLQNNSEDTLCYGEAIRLKHDTGEVGLKDGYAWDSVLYIIKPGGSRTLTCSLNCFDLSKDGNYRLEKEFYFKGADDIKYTAFVEFKLGEQMGFVQTMYEGDKIVYENGSYSSVLYTDGTLPKFAVTRDMHLGTNDWPSPSYSGEMFDLGALTEIKLSADNFDGLFAGSDWKLGYSAEKLRRDNTTAWKVENHITNGLYYLLSQKNGDIYIAQGYPDAGFRWVFKMSEYDSYEKESNTSGAYTSGMVFFYKDATIEREEPELKSYSAFNNVEMADLLNQLQEETWTADSTLDRASFYFDGQIYYDNWIYFSYGQNIVYHEWGHFCEVDDAVLDMIRAAEARAQEYSLEAFGGRDPFAIGGGLIFDETITYRFRDSTRIGGAELSLSAGYDEFSFTLSPYSSYAPYGRYVETEDELILTSRDDPANVYVFKKQDDTLIFDAKSSSPVPSFRYSYDGEPMTCIPDGAVFVIDEW